MSDMLKISTFWFELSGPAMEYASYALDTTNGLSTDEDLETDSKILEQIYIALWSSQSFVHSFEKSQNIKIKVVTVNGQAASEMFNQYYSHQLKEQLNKSISAIEHMTGFDCGVIDFITVTEMKTDSISILDYNEMKEQSQINIMQILKQNVHKQTQEPHASHVDPRNMENTESQMGQSQKVGTTVQLIRPEKATINTGDHYHQTVNPESTALDVTALGDKLKHELKNKAENCSRFENAPDQIKKAYAMALLEIAENTPISHNNFEYETNFHQREKLSQRFGQGLGNIKINEIFIKSREQAAEQKAAYSQSYLILNSLGLNTVRPINPNIIGVIGQAGIGKTTFTKMLIQQVLSGQFPEPVSFLFYLFVREIDFSRDCNVFQFLVRSALPEWEFTEERDHVLMKKIIADEDVLVVIDGFDEAELTNSRFANISSYDKTSPELILLNLMSGNILPLAKKVITSRPAELIDLDPATARPGFLLKILGLSKESQDILGQQICGEKYKDLKMMLYKNPDLSLYWYVPIYCILAFSYFANTENMESVSLTLTSLLTATLIDYAHTEHIRGKGVELKKLAHLAWKGIWSHQCIFPLIDLEKVGLDYNTVQAFLQMAHSRGLHVNMSILQGHKLTFFPHLIWQEFFASIHAMLKMSITEVDNYCTNVHRRSQVVTKFLFGLCNRKVFYQLQAIIPEYSTHKWVEKKKFLTQHLRNKVTWKYDSLLEAGSLLLETQDDDMLASVLDALQSNGDETSITLQGSVLPSDAVSLCYVLKGFTNKGGSIERIAVQSDPEENKLCSFDEDAFNRFADEIKSGIKIKEFVLSGVKFGDEGTKAVSGCIPQVEQLAIERCNITQNGIPHIVEKLSELTEPITKLKLGGNKLTDAGAERLAPGISHIKELHLDDCDITHVGVDKMVKGIKDNNAQMDFLSLAGNRVGNEGAKSLATCLNQMKKLILLMCNITEDGVLELASNAKELEHKMDLLDLSENEIGEGGLQALSLCAGKIDTLRLLFCGVSNQPLEGINVIYSDDLNDEKENFPSVKKLNYRQTLFMGRVPSTEDFE